MVIRLMVGLARMRCPPTHPRFPEDRPGPIAPDPGRDPEYIFGKFGDFTFYVKIRVP